MQAAPWTCQRPVLQVRLQRLLQDEQARCRKADADLKRLQLSNPALCLSAIQQLAGPAADDQQVRASRHACSWQPPLAGVCLCPNGASALQRAVACACAAPTCPRSVSNLLAHLQHQLASILAVRNKALREAHTRITQLTQELAAQRAAAEAAGAAASSHHKAAVSRAMKEKDEAHKAVLQVEVRA